ncbi:hypothetical protein GUITHDRAFT_69977 [Guillardia theta CCMP2712]|uniref:Uncharacterized protein n=2 Tax=Guillardia theta TaxID=55529 RepID=L1JGI9_GUITC|nr:hypothetical protein GUITHDRAFT_69977 [Guillardia theta CCMP2712]EKX47210.1 hypothetical protein GUITHDRAFT_69977 [Guillardia theta CCMP2712]|eukprot:XP_005834190.1 hypothetical protein GUITHDRAFT_69977 [Guillardia theta CCMP2712]
MQLKSKDFQTVSVWRDHLLAMATYGAMLGPQLDGYHSAFGVLKYTNPKQISLAGHFLFETDYWVPAMFALASVILGISYPILDMIFKEEELSVPTPPKSLACVSFFCFQYYCSGLLFQQGVEDVSLHLSLAISAVACWWIFDRTRTGAIMSIVTGLCGPLVEVFLLQVWPAWTGQTLYAYSAPDMLGIPLWIAWVYGCGAPAVGGLSRLTWNYVSTRTLNR